MKNVPRKHHFVQAEHLRQFVNDEGFLWIHGKDGRTFPASPEGIFKKKDLNSFETLDGINTSFENLATRVENECWPALVRVIERENVANSDLDAITFYLSFSRMRNPSFQEGTLENHWQVVETTAKLMDAQGKFDDIAPNPISPNKSVSELIDAGELSIEINNSEYLRHIKEMTEKFSNLLLNGFRWSVVKSPRGRVIISDHPLTYLHPGEHPGAYGIVPGGKTCEIAFPISKNHYLLGMWGDGLEDFESENVVDELNKRQAIFANRHIAGSNNKKWIRVLAKLYSRFGFQTVCDRIGPLDGGYQITRMGVYQLPGTKTFKGSHPLEKTVPVRKIKREYGTN